MFRKDENIGMKFAEKWKLEDAQALFQKAYDILIKDESIAFIGTLAIKLDTYRDLFKYLSKKFETDELIFLTNKKIHDIIEQRLFNLGLTNQNNPTLTIFGLKNNHNWRDKVESEVTQSTTLNIVTDNPEELDKLLDN